MTRRLPQMRYIPEFCDIHGSRMRSSRQREVSAPAGRQAVGAADRIQRHPVEEDEENTTSFCRLPTSAAGALLGSVPATAQLSAESAGVEAATLTAGRLVGAVAVLVALAGVVIGGLALARSSSRAGNGNGRRSAVVAMVAGLAATAAGGLVVVAAEGGPGTGYGIVGGFMALVAGLVATVLGWLALARSRRTGPVG
ncbi:DUF6223 family protein [Micromonospora sp. LOL_024]|uniref:DUF6223 family protein n=1 Tax=Micromonospora sp. LOL_024 TaxID=3345412 RepID=UPI003A84E6CB